MFRSFFAIALAFFGATTQGATLNEILQKHSEALGGWEKLSKVTSAVVKAETELGGMAGTSTTYYKAPDKFRIDLNLPIMNYTQACAGDDCWMRDQAGLVHSLGGDLKGLVVTQMALDRGSYLRPDKFDGTVTLLDSTITVGSANCYEIKIAPNGGSPAMMAIDTASFLTKRVMLVTDMAVVYSFPDDYRPVEGLMMPYKSTEMTDAGITSGVSRVQEIKFNVPVADSLFSPGAKAGPGIAAADVVVPFELYRNHIYFNAEVPGQGTLRFIFDSGAGGVGLNKDLVERLKLKKLGEVEARGVGGADVSEVYQLDSLNIADLGLSDVPVYAMDLAPLEAAGTKRIDGIIGYELLSRYAITVDYEHFRLVIHRAANPATSEWGNECRLNLDFRLPYIDARINEAVIGRFRLDTGSGSTIDFNSPFVERNKLLAEDRSGYHPVMAFGIGGGSAGLIGQLSTLEICDYRIDSVMVNYSTSETGIFAGAQTAGNIGAGILKRFIVTFDYPNEVVYFQPVSRFNQLNRIRNMAGLELKRDGDRMLVADILPGRSADKLLISGDRIIAIGGEKADGMPIERANQLLTGARDAKVMMEVLRDGKKISVELMLDSLY